MPQKEEKEIGEINNFSNIERPAEFRPHVRGTGAIRSWQRMGEHSRKGGGRSPGRWSANSGAPPKGHGERYLWKGKRKGVKRQYRNLDNKIRKKKKWGGDEFPLVCVAAGAGGEA